VREPVAWLRRAGYQVRLIAPSGGTCHSLASALEKLESIRPRTGIMYTAHVMATALERSPRAVDFGG
jgi:hypothetical protein